MNQFNFDINATTYCNLRCSYCTEKERSKQLYYDDIDGLIHFFDSFLQSNFFIKEFDRLKISFWGGEPSLNPPLVKALINKYFDNEKVSFFIYSNGYDINEILVDKLIELNKRNRFEIQISYDGNPIHDKNRLDLNKSPTSFAVLATIKNLSQLQLNFNLKSTFTLDDLKQLPSAYLDVTNIIKEYLWYSNNSRYAPTLDYLKQSVVNDIEKYKDDILNALEEICYYELLNYRDLGRYFINWFCENNLNRTCTAGRQMAAIDINGDIYVCHGALYNKNDSDLKYSNIYKDSAIQDIAEMKSKLAILENPEIALTESCKECKASVCLRCNTAKYFISNKKDFIERWCDNNNQPQLCYFYQIVSKVKNKISALTRN